MHPQWVIPDPEVLRTLAVRAEQLLRAAVTHATSLAAQISLDCWTRRSGPRANQSYAGVVVRSLQLLEGQQRWKLLVDMQDILLRQERNTADNLSTLLADLLLPFTEERFASATTARALAWMRRHSRVCCVTVCAFDSNYNY